MELLTITANGIPANTRSAIPIMVMIMGNGIPESLTGTELVMIMGSGTRGQFEGYGTGYNDGKYYG